MKIIEINIYVHIWPFFSIYSQMMVVIYIVYTQIVLMVIATKFYIDYFLGRIRT